MKKAIGFIDNVPFIKKLIFDTAKELEETGIAATDAEILKALLEKLQK